MMIVTSLLNNSHVSKQQIHVFKHFYDLKNWHEKHNYLKYCNAKFIVIVCIGLIVDIVIRFDDYTLHAGMNIQRLHGFV